MATAGYGPCQVLGVFRLAPPEGGESCHMRPLRAPASLLHIVLFCKVCASRSAKAPLGAAHRCAPWRVYKTHNMQSALRWGWAPQPSALPGRIRALRAAVCAPCQWRGPLALVRRFAQCSGQWPADPLQGCGDGRALDSSGIPGGREIIPETAWSRTGADLDRRSSAQHPVDQEGSIILMTTGSNLQLSSGHRRK